MKPIKNYIVDLEDVKEGFPEELSFTLGDAFFSLFEGAPMSKGSTVSADVSIACVGLGEFDIEIRIEGVLVVPCARCLAHMDLDVSNTDLIKVRYGMDILIGNEFVSMTDSVNTAFDYTLEDGETQFDLSWSIYEIIALSIPIQNIHPEDECDPRMVDLLQEHLAVQPGDNDEATGELSDPEPEDIDPRWNELKKILNNN